MSFEQVTVIYAAYVTEWESGWGTRPDGIVLGKTEKAVAECGKQMIERRSPHGYEYIGEIFAVKANEEGIKLLTDKTVDEFVWVPGGVKKYGTKL